MVRARLRYAGASDTGRVRRNNEDAFFADVERGFFLVVDGIGGQAAGEQAAAIAVQRIRARMERQTGATEQRIREAIAVANNEIFEAANSRKDWEGMACVLTLAAVENGSAVIGHVGDSRLYQIRRGEIRKITHDHSPVGEREDSGELSEAEAMRHPRRNEIFRDVGSARRAPDDPDFIEVIRAPFEEDSALVLCSDGLSDLVDSKTIRLIVERNAGNPEAAVKELIDAANRAGGKDNVTALVVAGPQFESTPQPRRKAPLQEPKGVAWLSLALAALGIAGALWAAYVLFVRPVPIVERPPSVVQAGAGAAYSSIGAAVAQARAGDTVEVAAGEYREQIALKSGVALRSAVPGGAILRAAPMSSGPVITAQGVAKARVSGFRILADPQAPLSAGVLLGDSGVEIDDVEIVGAETGIEIRGSASPVLRANSIRDCGTGVLIAGASQPWISHNTIRRSKRAGIVALDGARPWLSENVFEKSALELPPEVQMDEVRARNTFIGPAPLVRGGKKQ
jgi:PPM family protein phosphatase